MENGIPFFKIRRGSRIALYGCGKSGTVCYGQLVKSGYCSLAVIVDQNHTGRVLEGNSVKPVSELETVDYDCILITIMDERISRQVKNSFLEKGIPERKILTMHDRPKALTMECVENQEYMQKYLVDSFGKMCSYAKRPVEYYQELAARLSLAEHEKEHVFECLKTLLSVLKDEETKFILLVLMYQYGYFDKQCMESFMKCMRNAKWNDDTYYGFIIDSTVMVFVHPDYIYNNFFTDRKALQKKICAYYKLYTMGNVQKTEKKRIAIITSVYAPENTTEAVSVLVRKYAMEFVDFGYDVKIFVVRRDVDVDFQKVFLIHRMPNGICKKSTDRLTSAKKISICESLNMDVTERLQTTLKNIMEYHPSFLLDMADERFPEAYALIRYFPIFNLPMRGNAYSSEADIYLSIDADRVKKDNNLYHAVPQEDVREIPLSYLGQKETAVLPYKREEYGLKKEDFIMVTVGGRLSLDIDDKMIKCVCRLLMEKENIKWILVGDRVKCENRLFHCFLDEGRIIHWGHEDYLENLYGMCDIYLNPNRMGGGVSIRRAMWLGMPIVMTDFPSDALPCMPTDYVIHGGYGELMEYAARLSEDRELCQKVSEKTLEKIRTFTSKSDVEKILEVYEEWEISAARKKNFRRTGDV